MFEDQFWILLGLDSLVSYTLWEETLKVSCPDCYWIEGYLSHNWKLSSCGNMDVYVEEDWLRDRIFIDMDSLGVTL